MIPPPGQTGESFGASDGYMVALWRSKSSHIQWTHIFPEIQISLLTATRTTQVNATPGMGTGVGDFAGGLGKGTGGGLLDAGGGLFIGGGLLTGGGEGGEGGEGGGCFLGGRGGGSGR